MGKYIGVALLVLCLLAGCAPRETPPESSTAPQPSGSAVSESSSVPEVPEDAASTMKGAVEEAVRQYKSGTAPANAPELPEGFLFPETLDWDTIQVEEDGMGGCQVLIPSAATESPREGLFINGPEKAVFCWNGSSLETVSFQLDRSERVEPIVVDSDDLVTAAVADMIAQYKNKTVTVTENIPALPEGFVFPEKPDWEKLKILFNDVLGDFRVTVPSAQGEQTATFICYKFAVMDDNDDDTGKIECHVANVIFQ